MKKKNFISELVFLGILFLIGAAFCLQLIEPENDPFMIVDSVEYARVIMALFMLALIGVIIQSTLKFKAYLKSPAAKEEKNEPQEADRDVASDRLVNMLVIVTAVVFFFYCFFIKRLGYYSTGFVILVVYQMALYKAQQGHLDKKGMIKILLISVATIAALYLLFSVAFELYLPRGILI